MVTVRRGPVDGLWKGVVRTWEVSLLTLRMMGRMVIGEASLKNLSGPLTIADYAGKSASLGLTQYLLFLAMISVSLGVLNLLPLPSWMGAPDVLSLGGRHGQERLRRLDGAPAARWRGGAAGDDVDRAVQRRRPSLRLEQTTALPQPPRARGRFRFNETTIQALPRAYRLGCRALVFAVNSWAVDPFTVRDIRVEGLQRVEPGTVFASLPFRVGDQYNDDKGSAAIRSLFALGLFKDVRLETNGDVLVVMVEERPTVADVDFVGTKEFDKDT
jgi:hypothetical protein